MASGAARSGRRKTRESGWRRIRAAISGADSEPLRRKCAKTARRMAGRSRIAESRPGRHGYGNLRTGEDLRRYGRYSTNARPSPTNMPHMRGPGLHGTRLPRRVVCRFGGGSAADPMKVRRGRSGPERLAEMSRLILDRMTGREPPAGREGLPVGRKALRGVPPFTGMSADIGGRRRTVIAADASLSTGHDRACGRADAARSFGAQGPSVKNASVAPVPRPCRPGPIPRHIRSPVSAGTKP